MADKPDKVDFEYNSQLVSAVQLTRMIHSLTLSLQDAFELYHLVIEDDRRPSHRNGGPVLPALGHAIAGSAATATSKLVTYPLDLVVARLQVQKQLRSSKGTRGTQSEYHGLLDAASKIYQHEGGLSAFYTGCLTDVSKGIADSFLFFLAYSYLQQRELLKSSAKRLTVAQEMGLGIVSGAFAKFFTTPLQNIITRQQTAALAVAHDPEKDDGLKKGDSLSVLDIARQIHKEKGLAGFWTGYSLSLILTLNPAITFAVDNFLQKTLRAKDATPRVTFLVAAVSKAVATAITYPVSVAKSRAQAKPSGQESEVQGTKKPTSGQNNSVFSRLAQLFAAQYAVLLSMRKIYQQDGVSGLYSGIEGEVLKGFLSHGLTMMMKDRVHDGVIELYYVLLRLTSSWPGELAAQQDNAAELITDARDRAENVGVTAYEAGKSAASSLTAQANSAGSSAIEAGRSTASSLAERASNIGTTVAEAGKNAASDIAERANNVGTTVVEAGKSAIAGTAEAAERLGSSMYSSARNAAVDGSSRAENVGVTVAEASKNVASEAASRASNLSTSTYNAGSSVAADVKARAENIGVTAFEAGKSIVGAAGEQAGNASTEAAKLGKSALSEANQRVDNVGVSIVEAGKSVVKDVKS